MADLILAIAHHLLIFLLAAVLTAEIVVVRPAISSGAIELVARVDGAYGAIAGLILVVGIGRVFLSPKGAGYYLTNVWFWLKMAAFLITGLLSIGPTRQLILWRRRAAADPGFTPPASEVIAARRFMWSEVVAFAFIPAFAAVMARYG